MRCGAKFLEAKLLWVRTIVSQAIAAQTIIGWVVKGAASMRGEVVTDCEYLIIPHVIYD